MNGHSRQSGVALVTALLVVAIATTAATALLSRQTLDVRRTSNLIDGDQSWLYAQGAEAWAMAILARDRKESEIDSLKELWATQLPPIELPGGFMVGRLEDLHARFNVNNLVASGKLDAIALAQFQRLLTSLELDRNLAYAVVDWIDRDIEAIPPDGAEDDYYAGMTPPYRTANRPLADISELRLVKGFDEKTYARIAPYVVALPEKTTINVNTAPAMVIASISDNLDPQKVTAAISGRKKKPFKTVDEIFQNRNIGNARFKDVEKQALGVSSKYFLARIESRIGYGHATVNSVLLRNSANSVQLLSRSVGSLPEITPPAKPGQDDDAAVGNRPVP